MKYSKLKELVNNWIVSEKLNNEYMGKNICGDSVYNEIFERFKSKLIHELDLKPSEFFKLDDVEIGEPLQFSEIISKTKLKLIKNIHF